MLEQPDPQEDLGQLVHQGQGVMLVLPDHQDLVEMLDFKDQRVSQEILDLQVQLDLLVSQDQVDHPVQGVSLDRVVDQDL